MKFIHDITPIIVICLGFNALEINFDRSTSEFCGRNRFRSRRYIYMWVIRVRNRFNLAKSQMSHLLAQPFERGGGK